MPWALQFVEMGVPKSDAKKINRPATYSTDRTALSVLPHRGDRRKFGGARGVGA
jgi:hypothetical protein